MEETIEILEVPVEIKEEEQPPLEAPSFEVAMFQVRGDTEGYTISGDKIVFVPRIELLRVEHPIENQVYPNSEIQDGWLRIKQVVLFAKVN